MAKALDDPHISVRRMAAVYIGDIKDPQILPYLYKALIDRSAAVRRTAGDTLSDLGDPAAIGAMTQALNDPSKIVRCVQHVFCMRLEMKQRSRPCLKRWRIQNLKYGCRLSSP